MGMVLAQWCAGVSLVFLVWACVGVQGHGRLFEPPGRSTAWRYGFKTPPNYNDHELYCGGFARQWQKNSGKCGPCGDAWDVKRPRPNEAGGKFGRGVIVKSYKHSSPVRFGVELTANHYGFFEFRLCPHNQPSVPVTNECLDQYVLKKDDGSGTRYYPGPGSKKFYAVYRLPYGLTCTQCVIQWRYVAGNNWGRCENGTGMVGCGPQEEFRACADIRITEEDGSADSTPSYIPEYEYPEYEDTEDTNDVNDVEYNEVDVDSWDKEEPKGPSTVEVNHIGHVVALVFAFLLILLVLFGLVAYFYWARDAFKGFMKKRKEGHWRHTAPPAPFTSQKSSVVTISRPITAPPPVPPRRNRTAPDVPAAVPANKAIRSISSPIDVTINGIAVKSNKNMMSQAPLHVPE